MGIRIVAGKFRGQAIQAPTGISTRPTTDRVREALFSSIYSRTGGLEGMFALDAFAGSGALGFEALSRGVGHVVFCERDAAAARVIQANAKALGLDRRSFSLSRADALASSFDGKGSPFGLVLLDPPYALPASDIAAFLGRLHREGTLDAGALICYEHALKDGPLVDDAFATSPLSVQDRRRYGKIAVTFIKETL